MKANEGEGSSDNDFTEIDAAAETLDGSVIFHTVNDVLGFVLYMHQQIPSPVQDMSIEFDTMHTEYKQLAIRTLISKGAGSATYPGPSKLFLLLEDPSSFNQPMHILPKRDFRHNKKIVPFNYCLSAESASRSGYS